jgi:hypothetical protein
MNMVSYKDNTNDLSYVRDITNERVHATTRNVREGMENHPSTHTLLRRRKKRVESPLGFITKLRNLRVRIEGTIKGGKAIALIMIFRYY